VGRLWQRRQENVDCAGARAGSKLLYAVVILSTKLMKLVNRPRPYKTPEGTTKALLVHLVRDHISFEGDSGNEMVTVDPADAEVFLARARLVYY
jgi:hypothetical protein